MGLIYYVTAWTAKIDRNNRFILYTEDALLNHDIFSICEKIKYKK
jgi:hypothetical protein